MVRTIHHRCSVEYDRRWRANPCCAIGHHVRLIRQPRGHGPKYGKSRFRSDHRRVYQSDTKFNHHSVKIVGNLGSDAATTVLCNIRWRLDRRADGSLVRYRRCKSNRRNASGHSLDAIDFWNHIDRQFGIRRQSRTEFQPDHSSR